MTFSNILKIALVSAALLSSTLVYSPAALAGKGGQDKNLTNEQLLLLFAARNNNSNNVETPPSPFVPKSNGGGGKPPT